MSNYNVPDKVQGATDETGKFLASDHNALKVAVNSKRDSGNIPAAEVTESSTKQFATAAEKAAWSAAAGGSVSLTGVQTLTNKTISGVNNTITNVSADNVIDGITNKAFLTTERTKLTNIQALATANITDTASAALMDTKDTAVLATIRGGVATAGDNLSKLYALITALNAIVGGSTADGDSVTNTVAEILAVMSTYPEGVSVVTALAGKIDTTAIINTLTETTSNKVLDARQGKALSDLITALTGTVALKETKRTFNVKDYGATGDGTTNDYTAITAAMTAASTAGGGVVSFPKGTYITSPTLAVPSNVDLRGDNRYTSIIKSNTTGSYSLVTLTSVSGVSISGLRFEGPAAGTPNTAVTIVSGSNNLVTNCTFNNRFLLVILVGNEGTSTVNCGVTYSNFEGSSGEGVEIVDGNYCFIEGNNILSMGANGAIVFRRSVGNFAVGNRITGNFIKSCRVGITDGGGQKTQIVNNQVLSCTQSGITMQDGFTTSLLSTDGICDLNQVDGCNTSDAGFSNISSNPYASGWIISNNISRNSVSTSGTGGVGIEINGTHNTIIGNKTKNTATNGIYIIGDRNYVIGNTVIDPSQVGVGSRDGIQGHGKYCTYIGNVTYDSIIPVRMRYGLFLPSNSQNCIVSGHTGNVGTASPPINDAGTSNLIYGNAGDVAPVTTASLLRWGTAAAYNISVGATFGELKMQYGNSARATFTLDANNTFGATVGGAGHGGVTFQNGSGNSYVSGNGTTLNLNGSGGPVAIGIATTNPVTSQFEVGGTTTKGSRPYPSLTTTQRDAISSPVEGLTIYNTTTHTINFHNGTTWKAVVTD